MELTTVAPWNRKLEKKTVTESQINARCSTVNTYNSPFKELQCSHLNVSTTTAIAYLLGPLSYSPLQHTSFQTAREWSKCFQATRKHRPWTHAHIKSHSCSLSTLKLRNATEMDPVAAFPPPPPTHTQDTAWARLLSGTDLV